MEVVEGQDTVVDGQQAKEPGGTDQQQQQKGTAKGPAERTWEDTGGHTRVRQGSHRAHGRTQLTYMRRWRSQEVTREMGSHIKTQEYTQEAEEDMGNTKE